MTLSKKDKTESDEVIDESRRITRERHDRVMWSGVCPGCGDYRIVTMIRWKGSNDALDRRRTYGGSYLCCGGPEAHECWHMTKDPNASRLYETFGPKASNKCATG